MSRINYRPDDLRALQALQVTLSFVRGAEMLHISQSAFSRRITQLEAALGVSLVERSTRRVAISSAGQALLREAGPLLDALDEAVAQARRRAIGHSGQLVLACLSTVVHAHLPPVLAKFRQRYPEVRIQLRDDDTGQRVTASVLQHEAEFGVSTLGPPAADLHAAHVANDRLVAAFQAGHPLEEMKEVGWSELARWRPLSLRLSSDKRQQMDEDLVSAGLPPTRFDEVEHLSSMFGFLLSGMSVGVLPELALGAGRGDLQSRPLVRPSVVRRIGLIRRVDSELSEPGQFLWSALAKALGEPKQ